MSEHSSSTQTLHVDEHTIEEMHHHMRRYKIVGVALAVGTALTVWASLINFGSREINIVVALIIASAKGFLVAGFFMHLISEKKMIYAVLSFTAFFFTGLLFLTLWSMAHDNIIQIHLG
jgi:cytochrome c oxidase subunit IV